MNDTARQLERALQGIVESHDIEMLCLTFYPVGTLSNDNLWAARAALKDAAQRKAAWSSSPEYVQVEAVLRRIVSWHDSPERKRGGRRMPMGTLREADENDARQALAACARLAEPTQGSLIP